MNNIKLLLDGNIAFASADRILIKNLTGELVRDISSYGKFSDFMEVSPDGNLVVASKNENIRIINPNTGEFVKSFVHNVGQVGAISIMPNGNIAIAGYHANYGIEIIDPYEVINPFSLSREYDPKPGILNYFFKSNYQKKKGNVIEKDMKTEAMGVLPNGNLVIVNKDDIKVINPDTGKIINRINHDYTDDIEALIILSNEKIAIVQSYTRLLMIFIDLELKKVKNTRSFPLRWVNGSFAFPDGKIAIFLSNDDFLEYVRIYNPTKNKFYRSKKLSQAFGETLEKKRQEIIGAISEDKQAEIRNNEETNHYFCPISLELIVNPVALTSVSNPSSKVWYERENIEKWFYSPDSDLDSDSDSDSESKLKINPITGERVNYCREIDLKKQKEIRSFFMAINNDCNVRDAALSANKLKI